MKGDLHVCPHCGRDPRGIVIDSVSRLYVIEAPHVGLIKIGVSRSPETRCSGLQKEHPQYGPLRLVLDWPVSDSHLVERVLLNALNEYAEGGEWFRLPNRRKPRSMRKKPSVAAIIADLKQKEGEERA